MKIIVANGEGYSQWPVAYVPDHVAEMAAKGIKDNEDMQVRIVDVSERDENAIDNALCDVLGAMEENDQLPA